MYQCGGYLYGYKDVLDCHQSFGISENLLHHMCAKIINDLYLKDKKLFSKMANLIKRGLSNDGIEKLIEEKQKDKERMSSNIDFLLKERLEATTADVKEKIDSQYTALVAKYQQICEDIRSLQNREKDNIDVNKRLEKMLKILEGKEVTAEMINIEMLDAFIYRIIVIDKKHVVVTINVLNALSLEDVRNQRKEIAEKEPIYQGQLIMKDPVKRAEINYKVVMV